MNFWIKRTIIILVGTFGAIFAQIPISAFYSFDPIMKWHMNLLVVYAISIASAYASIKLVKNPNPIKTPTKKLLAMIIAVIVGLIVLVPGGILTRDLAYGQCMIITRQDFSSGHSFSVGFEPECIRSCIVSDIEFTSDGHITQCEFKGLAHSWTRSAQDFSLQEKQLDG